MHFVMFCSKTKITCIKIFIYKIKKKGVRFELRKDLSKCLKSFKMDYL